MTDKARNMVWRGEGPPPHAVSIEMYPPFAINATEEEARAGIYHEHAGLIIQNNHNWKEFVETRKPEASK